MQAAALQWDRKVRKGAYSRALWPPEELLMDPGIQLFDHELDVTDGAIVAAAKDRLSSKKRGGTSVEAYTI